MDSVILPHKLILCLGVLTRLSYVDHVAIPHERVFPFQVIFLLFVPFHIFGSAKRLTEFAFQLIGYFARLIATAW